MEINDIISSGLLELYVTGSTSTEETLQVERWAEQYPEVKRELEELQAAMEQYALSNSIQPRAEVKERIFDRINTSSVKNYEKPAPTESARVYAIPSYFKWMAAASAVLLIGSIVLNFLFYNRNRSYSEELTATRTELKKQQELADAMNKDMGVMTDKNAMPVVLSGTEKAPDALAKIFWMKNTGDVYVDPTNLPVAPSGMQYQLWAIVDGKPVDAGMISTAKGTYHIQKMKSFGKAEAFAITLETAGGHPTPKGDMIVHAKI